MSECSKVLITGGAGFVGSHLVDSFLLEGYRIVVLDNFEFGRMENVNVHLKNENFVFVEGDIRDRKTVRRAMKGVDAVIHLAALIDVEESVKNPCETFDVNVTGTFYVLEEAVRSGVQRFVYASSTVVYGDTDQLPLCEDFPFKLLSPYAASKASSECYCMAFHETYGLETVVLRYFNIYGCGQEHNPYGGVVIRFVKNALKGKPLTVFGNGNQTRDFVYVDDVVRATMLALENSDAVGKVFNVCTGTATSVNDLVCALEDIVGRKLRVNYSAPRKGDIRYSYGDPLLAKKMLGFEAKTELRSGLERLLKSM